MIRKKIEKAVVIGFAVLAVFVFVRGFWLKNRKEPEKKQGDEKEISVTATESVVKNNTPTAAIPTRGEEPTAALTPTDSITPTADPTATSTPFPTPTEVPINILNKPTPVPTLPTPTPVPEGIEDPGVDDRDLELMDIFLADGYETLYDTFSLFRKTETTTDIANARMRRRTEYLSFLTPYDAPAVVYIDEFYQNDENNIIEKHVHCKKNANNPDEQDITVFHSHKDENGEWVYDMLLPDGTTVASVETDFIARVEKDEFPTESALSGIISLQNKRVKDYSVDGKFGFSVTLDYEDCYTYIDAPDPYRSFTVKVWFMDKASYKLSIDERGKEDETAFTIAEIKDTIKY